MSVPMKLSEWNIMPSPVLHKIRQEIARLQWTIRSKASVACINPFLMAHSPPFWFWSSSGSFGP